FIQLRLWTWATAVVLLAVLVQMHLGALLLAPVVAVLFLLSRPDRRAWLVAALGAVLAAALFLPYLAFEAAHQPDFLPRRLGSGGGSAWWGVGRCCMCVCSTP